MTGTVDNNFQPVRAGDVGQLGPADPNTAANKTGAAGAQFRLQGASGLMDKTLSDIQGLIGRFQADQGNAASIVPNLGKQAMIMDQLVNQATVDLSVHAPHTPKETGTVGSDPTADEPAHGPLTDEQTKVMWRAAFANSLTPEEDAVVQDLKTEYQIDNLDPSQANTLTPQQKKNISTMKALGLPPSLIQQRKAVYLQQNKTQYDMMLDGYVKNLTSQQRELIDFRRNEGASEDDIAEMVENLTLVNKLVADGVMADPYALPVPSLP